MTLLEVIIALVLVSVGLLGFAGSSALMLRATVAQASARRATRLAALRFVNLSATGCASARDGAFDDVAAGLHERWHVGPPTGGAVTIDDSITWIDRGVPRTLILRTASLC